jgi:hypothetical protein
MTNYWIGPLCLAYLATAVSVMVSVSPLAAFQRYLLDLLPLTLCYIVIRPVAIAAHRHPSVVPRPLWRAVALVYFTWPIYTMAWLMAVLRLRLAFRPTPKEATGSIHPAWLFPQLLGMLCLALGAGTMLSAGGHCADTVARYPLVLAFAAVQCLLPLIVLVQRLNRHRLQGIRDARKRIRSQQMGQLDHS